MSRTRHILMVALILVLLSAPLFAGGKAEQAKAAETGPAKVLWWSHWANEPAKVAVVERIREEYVASRPDVEIELVWWDKQPLQDAWRTAMAANSGAPDIVTDPAGDTLVQVEAGWFQPLGDAFPWENYKPGAKDNAKYGTPGDFYKYNIGQSINMIFYNKEIFKQLGIVVPKDYTFTADEWIEITRKVKSAGYSGTALASGNRPYAGTFPLFFSLFSRVGRDQAYRYINGLQSWDTAEARQVLDWSVKMRDAGFWPDTYATMTIDEFHVYFHTQKKAATLWIPSWYTGRSFKAEAEGGQSPSFQFGMLRYPKFPGGVAHDKVIGSYESGYMISAASKRPDVARDILAFATKPRYGALWELMTDSPAAIKYEKSDIPQDIPPSKWSWYHEEIAKVYGPLQMETLELLAPPERTGDFMNATTTALNQGLPMNLISVDEAVKQVNAAVKK